MHALGGMDTGDEEGGDDEGGNADQERGRVEGQDDRPGDLHGDRADIVGLGVEGDEAREVLEGDEAEAYGVAPEQALGQDERGKPQEDVAHINQATRDYIEKRQAADSTMSNLLKEPFCVLAIWGHLALQAVPSR